MKWDIAKLLAILALVQKVLPEILDLFKSEPPVMGSCPDCPEELKASLQAICDHLNK